MAFWQERRSQPKPDQPRGRRKRQAQTTTAQLSSSLAENEALLRHAMREDADIRFHRFTLRWGERSALLLFAEGLVSIDGIHAHVLNPLMELKPDQDPPAQLGDWGRQLVQVADQRVLTDLEQLRLKVYRGKTALLIDGCQGALILGVEGWEQRQVQAPPTESLLKGPRDGFVENIATNLALVRRRICTTSLKVRNFEIGARSKTRVSLLHVNDITHPTLVHEVTTRLEAISFDAILDASQLREMLVGSGFSLFPKMELTERPDKIIASLLSGKIAILVDNSPFAITAPTTLIDGLGAPDDYYSMPIVTLFIRTVRTIGLLATLFASPLYIAVQMYTPEVVRTDLVLYLTRERLGVPLTAALEIYFLEVMSEMIFEGTVRLPSKIASAATVVGGLIIGQAAVQARVISGLVIIVVAISSIGSFTLPGPESGQIWRVTRWLLILGASLFGIYGIFTAAFCLVCYLASQDSFGVPYLAPVAPLIPQDLREDYPFRAPWGKLWRRPATYRSQDPDRAPRPQNRKYRDGGEL